MYQWIIDVSESCWMIIIEPWSKGLVFLKAHSAGGASADVLSASPWLKHEQLGFERGAIEFFQHINNSDQWVTIRHIRYDSIIFTMIHIWIPYICFNFVSTHKYTHTYIYIYGYHMLPYIIICHHIYIWFPYIKVRPKTPVRRPAPKASGSRWCRSPCPSSPGFRLEPQDLPSTAKYVTP